MSSFITGDERVLVRFSFSKIALIPDCLRTSGSPCAAPERRQVSGKLILLPVEKVDGLALPEDLGDMGYVLVDANAKVYNRDNAPSYAVVEFLFSRSESMAPTDEWDEALEELLNDAMWRVRAFQNPKYACDQVVDGHDVCFCFEARKPLCDDGGNALTEWRKDEHGQRIGDHPHEVAPEKFLKIRGGRIVVEDADDNVLVEAKLPE